MQKTKVGVFLNTVYLLNILPSAAAENAGLEKDGPIREVELCFQLHI